MKDLRLFILKVISGVKTSYNIRTINFSERNNGLVVSCLFESDDKEIGFTHIFNLEEIEFLDPSVREYFITTSLERLLDKI